jgi:hypothetical protein
VELGIALLQQHQVVLIDNCHVDPAQKPDVIQIL